MGTPIQVTFDCADPDRVARFWAELLHYKLQDPPEGYESWEDFLKAVAAPEEEWESTSAIVDPEGKLPRLFFQKVPEGKTVKNRVHLDVNIGGTSGTPVEERRPRVDAEVERAVGLGAKVIRPGELKQGDYWVVLQDVEGNEFCLQ